MTPLFFKITYWSGKPFAECNDISTEYFVDVSVRDSLTFQIGDDGKRWPDVIGTRAGLLLFSRKVPDAFRAEGVRGAEFIEAPITFVRNRLLMKKARPSYFRMCASAIIEHDSEVSFEGERFIPGRIVASCDSDVFHLKLPSGIYGYVCNRRVLEAIRRHDIGNLHIVPLDYYKVNKLDFFTPPFRLNVTGREWPPQSWYPDGFVPHAANLDNDTSN